MYKKNGKEDPSVIRRKLQIAVSFLKPDKIIWQVLPEFPFILELNCGKQKKAKPILLISGIPDLTLRNIRRISNRETLVIADGTNKLWKIKAWEKEAHELNLRFLSTSFTGSVTIDCH
jgi:hypothetical protein